jgi:hypothetical protein
VQDTAERDDMTQDGVACGHGGYPVAAAARAASTRRESVSS